MAPTAKSKTPQPSCGITWRPTKIMNMRDLSKDDDFLSHLLVEKLGTGTVPLLVHKMDPTRRLPKVDAGALLDIVKRLVASRQPVQHATRQAVCELISLSPVLYYLKTFTQKQINAFATHASRYFELYHYTGSIEIAHTSRYSHKTGKSELCILATRAMPIGTVISELKGSMANLTPEEDQDLKRRDFRNSDIRRDFSVIHSKQMKKNHLFLGPARFVNHDCDNNCELFREGKYITFRVIRPINVGDEITAHYGDGYFGRKNRNCLCETCEKNGRGGYASERYSSDDSDDDQSDSEKSEADKDTANVNINLNERRTRRGVYAIMQEEEDDSEESEDDESNVPLANVPLVPADEEIELEAPTYNGRDCNSRSTSRKSSSDRRDNGDDTVSSARSTRASSRNRLGSVKLSTSEIRGKPEAKGTSSKDTKSEINGVSDKSDAKQSKREDSPPPRRITRSLSALSPTKNVEEESTRSSRSKSQMQRKESSDSDAVSQTARSLADRLRRRLIKSPPSEDAPSPPDASSAQTTRHHSSERANGNAEEKRQTSSRLSTPSKSKTKEKVQEDQEARVLRARSSLSGNHTVNNDRPPKPVVPRGPDGKPLPTCSTCTNVLPVISVDSKIIWGLDTTPKKGRKKREKRDCPRCIRHLAIYGAVWPCRLATNRPPPPQDNSTLDLPVRSANQKAFPSLIRKSDATVPANTPSASKRRSPSEERPTKRRKTEGQEGASDKATTPQSNGGRTRSGRAGLPSVKMQEGNRRKRGRPPLPIPRRQVFAAAKPMKLKSLVVQSQPRDSNGRFGKKAETNGLYMRRRTASRNLGATARRLLRRAARRQNTIGQGIQDKQRAKYAGKPRDNDNNDEEAPRQKKLRHELSPTKNPYSRSGSGPTTQLAMSGLSFVPNPINLARRKWAPLMSNIDPETTADKNNLTISETSEPFLSSTTRPQRQLKQDIEKPIDENPCNNISLMSLSFHPSIGALTHKPSPVTFARRRWMNGIEVDTRRLSYIQDDGPSDSDFVIKVARCGSKSTPILFPTEQDSPNTFSRRATVGGHGDRTEDSDGAVEPLAFDQGENSSSTDEGPALETPRHVRRPPSPVRSGGPDGEPEPIVYSPSSGARRLEAHPVDNFLSLYKTFHAGDKTPGPNLHQAGWETPSDASFDN